MCTITRLRSGTVCDLFRLVATPPRRILPGTTWFITRRCSERRYFLRPSASTNDNVLYALGYTTTRYAVQIHGLCALSNHLHMVLTDVEGRLPSFMRELNSLIARSMNASLGRCENFWARGGSYSAVEPVNPSDVIGKIAYTLANPVAAGLVEHAADWPGLWTAPEKIGTTKLVVRRPEGFYDRDGDLPETVELELTVPPGFADAPEFRSQLAAELREREERHRSRLASEGRGFLGVASVLAQDPRSSPSSGEPLFGLNPRIAARDKWKRIEGILRLKWWEEEYQRARASWCAGARDVLFPAGTWLMRVLHGASCAGAG